MEHNVPTVITLSFFPMSTAVAIVDVWRTKFEGRPTDPDLRAVCGPVFPPQIRFRARRCVRSAVRRALWILS
jgi:hypothetical protein